MPEWIRMYVLVLLVLELFSELGGINFEALYLFVDRYLHTGVNLRLFGLSYIMLTIYFLRVEINPAVNIGGFIAAIEFTGISRQ